ncbi:hypothetical protein LEMLEM_LOCUS7026, partial [Lemmus lemmus]
MEIHCKAGMRWEGTTCSSGSDQSPPLALCWQELSGRPHGPDSTAVPSSLVVNSGPNQGHIFLLSEAPEIEKISKKIHMQTGKNIETYSHFIFYLKLLSYAP